MKNVLNVLLWISVGANLAFIATMQTMKLALANVGGITAAQLAVERTNFLNIQTTAFIVMIIIGAADLLASRRLAKRVNHG